ncbi:MAG TPA: NmrA family NAD(P)-binding protein [Candidatus Acidoferrales bacterium]|nr:NmrA family NAD(P)-binding protein [Candidatus Acidoferrales bacterium]
MYVITGATGNTGSGIAEALLARGEKVRVVGRSAEKLERFVQKGAEALSADLGDEAALARAFAGAKAVYVMIPPDSTSEHWREQQERQSDALAAALQKAGATSAVTLSSVGADKAEKVGPVNGLHALEEKLNRIAGLNVLHLRAGYFMENLLQYVGLIKTMGMLAGTLRSDLPIAMIATRDISAVAADELSKSGFSGKQTRELLGSRDVTMHEAATIIGNAIGRKLSYTQLPAMMVKPAMLQMGLSSQAAGMLLEMMEAMNTGWMKALEARSARTNTPTTLETFAADVFVPAYQGRAAGA